MQLLPPRTEELRIAAAPQHPPDIDPATRTVLVSRPPMPLLEYDTWQASTPQSIASDGAPLLVTFWSQSCATCLRELRAYTQGVPALSSKIRIVALSVDALQGSTGVEAARKTAERLELPFKTGVATPDTVAKLQIVARIALNHHGKFAVPLSLLIDGQGNVAVLYRGATSVGQVLEDIGLLEIDKSQLRDRALPMAGRWTTPPRSLLLRPVADVFREAGFREDYDRYLRLDMQRLADSRNAAADDEERASIDARYGTECFDLARSLQLQGALEGAVDYYRQELQVSPERPVALMHLAETLFALDRADQAIAALQKALELSPAYTSARLRLASHYQKTGRSQLADREIEQALAQAPQDGRANFQAGLLAARMGKLELASQRFGKVVELEPRHLEAWTNLAALRARQRDFPAALTVYEKAVDIDPRSYQARVGLGNVTAATGRFAEAATQLRVAIELQPDRPEARSALARVLLLSGSAAAAAEQLE